MRLYKDEVPNPLMEKIGEKVLTEIPIKKYKDSSHLRTDVCFENSSSLGITEQRLVNDIDTMECGPLNMSYLKTSFAKAENSSLLEYRKTSEEGKPRTYKLNTILIFKFNEQNNCIEIDALCSEMGGGTLFNYFLNVVKLSLVELQGEIYIDFNPLIVVESLNSAIKFYEKFKFVRGKTVGLTQLHRTVSVEPNNTPDADVIVIQQMTSTKGRELSPDNVLRHREDESAGVLTSTYAEVPTNTTSIPTKTTSIPTKTISRIIKRTNAIIRHEGGPHEGGPHKGGPHKGGTKSKSKTTRVLSKKKRRKTRRKRITHTNSGSSPHI
jgi:hypothetical protein